MTTDFDSLLRDAINDAAAQARPVNLGRAALRTARHNQINHRVAAGTVAVVAAGSLAGGYALVSAHAHARPAATTRPSGSTVGPETHATPSVTQQPVPLPGGWYIAGGTADDGVWIYDRVQERYRPLPYQWAWPAPTGDLVAVNTGGDTPSFGVLDLHSGQLKWLVEDDGTVGAAQWSADGRRLAYDGPAGVEIADAVTGQITVVPGAAASCTADCGPVWLPGDTEIAVPHYRGPLDEPDGMIVFDATTGEQTRTLPFQFGTGWAWSPDGRYVVASILSGGYAAVGVVDTATGRTVAVLDGVNDDRTVYWAGSGTVLAIVHGAVDAFSPTGALLGTYPLPSEFIDDELPSFSLALR
jgi:hypothetical protein